MLDHVGCQNKTKALRRKWQVANAALLHRCKPLILTDMHDVQVGIQPNDVCKFDFRQHAEIGAAAYANVEYQAAPANLRARDFIGKQWAPSRKPPIRPSPLAPHLSYFLSPLPPFH